MKIWIDTDIGGDIDDAFSLLLAFAGEGVEITGISTVFGDTVARARIVKTLCNMAGREDIPVFAGIGTPIKQKTVFYDQINDGVSQKTYIKEIFDNTKVGNTSAIEAMRDALLANPDEITVVTLGALTNVARLIKKYPDAAKKIKKLYIMGGAEVLNLNEFNITCDPEAAEIVFASEIDKYVTTLDVTFKCALSDYNKKLLGKCKSQCVKTVMRMNGRWGDHTILHDPLTLAEAIKGGFVIFEKGNLKVETANGFSRGKCVNLCDFNWKCRPDDHFYVSRSVDSKKFVDYFVAAVCELDKNLK